MVFLIGLSLLLYPTVSNWWNSMHQSRAVASYVGKVTNMTNTEYERMWKEATEYNKELAEIDTLKLRLTEEEIERYDALLDVSGTGIMGYVEIPGIHTKLPIYHGTDDSVLQVAVGHIPGTALPVGGEGTHCVISGHRGLPRAKLFTDLDKLVVGDLFTLNVLDNVLTYEVDQIRIVLPQEIDDIEPEEGKDYCTLITCTPYGVNSHRLLVRGRRTAARAVASVRITADALQISRPLVAVFIAVPLLLIITAVSLYVTGRRRKYRKTIIAARSEVLG